MVYSQFVHHLRLDPLSGLQAFVNQRRCTMDDTISDISSHEYNMLQNRRRTYLKQICFHLGSSHCGCQMYTMTGANVATAHFLSYCFSAQIPGFPHDPQLTILWRPSQNTCSTKSPPRTNGFTSRLVNGWRRVRTLSNQTRWHLTFNTVMRAASAKKRGRITESVVISMH